MDSQSFLIQMPEFSVNRTFNRNLKITSFILDSNNKKEYNSLM